MLISSVPNTGDKYHIAVWAIAVVTDRNMTSGRFCHNNHCSRFMIVAKIIDVIYDAIRPCCEFCKGLRLNKKLTITIAAIPADKLIPGMIIVKTIYQKARGRDLKWVSRVWVITRARFDAMISNKSIDLAFD
ncbi:hypothetical protein [Nostoc sp. MG11]|uniref:hypothetical protein n=1 Tax=Nostoc sp. MG11 TaxID=2721166 RepID=UPI00186849DC|nr:hypothetical protein [Nostoc sp. MG11]